MGVLDNPNVPDVPASVRVANQLKQQARMAYNQLVQVFNSGSQMFWQNGRATPVEIAEALGTDGKEVFQLHGKIGALLAEISPAAIQPGLSVVGEFSYNNDGSVTVVLPTAPEPTPEPNQPE